MSSEWIAHVRRNENGEWVEPQTLSDHAMGTAKRAEAYSGKFQSAAWGRALGLGHDAGKGRRLWQEYLRGRSGYGFDEEAHMEEKHGKVPHAIYGAKLGEHIFGKGLSRILSYCIAGHHAGLQDWSSAEGAGRSALQFQLEQVKDLQTIPTAVVELFEAAKPLKFPRTFARGLDLSLWIRMLYSSLVDADFLDTEEYMDGEKADNRGNYCTMKELLARFERFSQELDARASNTKINGIRRQIREKCLTAAEEAKGVFSLSVPTGGGKTLSSLAFGLKHAKKYELDRIIYVIPYTSILEQNADVFKNVVGKDQVVEHHSSLDEDGVTAKSRLAAENWDAPIVVTTSVQFFESLFAAKSSRCRKLHNIAKSVVVLDEAQLAPIEYLNPILEAMQLLVDHYQVSFVISTATQPAFEEQVLGRDKFKGLSEVKEIMGTEDEVKKLYESLQRAQVILPEDMNEETSWEAIAEKLKQHQQVLCIVSDRKSCRTLHGLMPEGTIHLSALMCGQHRSEVIQKIREKLKKNEMVRVISTQLVEAGVDFDFPVVYRALAGLDSIAQAAGRCNREGSLTELGKVFVFNAPKKPPLGILRKAAETTRSILAGSQKDPLNFAIYKTYFQELYWKANSLDKKEIIKLLTPDGECGIYFRTAAEQIRLIDDSLQKTILVRFGEGEDWIELLKAKGPERWLMRKLQRYTVNLYNEEFNQLLKRGSIEEIGYDIFALSSNLEYSDEVGLLLEGAMFDSERFIF